MLSENNLDERVLVAHRKRGNTSFENGSVLSKKRVHAASYMATNESDPDIFSVTATQLRKGYN